jgi:hypothetical protein
MRLASPLRERFQARQYLHQQILARRSQHSSIARCQTSSVAPDTALVPGVAVRVCVGEGRPKNFLVGEKDCRQGWGGSGTNFSRTNVDFVKTVVSFSTPLQ